MFRTYKGPDLLTTQTVLALKLYCHVVLKKSSDELALERRGQLFLHLTLLNMHFFWSFPFRRKSYGRRVFK